MRRRAVGLALVLLALAPGVAAAHVDVLPTRVAAGEAQEFTIRVPTEGKVATTGLRISFPADVTVFSFTEPPQGWTVKPVEGGGTFIAADYSGPPVAPSRYIEFRVLGTPSTPGTTVWQAVQRFADGTRKAWTGAPERPGDPSPETAPGTPGPAAAVQVVASGETTTAVAPAAGTTKRTSSTAGIWLGVLAVALSALALLATGLLWSGRPMRLPEDEPGT